MDSRYTNRDKMLNSISDRKLAELMNEHFGCYDCDNICPLSKTDRCPLSGFDLDTDNISNAPECWPEIEKWLGEKE